MKIKVARSLYYTNRKELTEQMKKLSAKKEEAEKKFKLTGESAFSEEAATLELSLEATQKAFEDNQKVIDSIMNQWMMVTNRESSQQQQEASKKEVEDIGKVMTVFRRMAKGDIVPQTDEKKLMEYNDKLYQMAKNMQAAAQLQEKKRKKHKSLWEEEEQKKNENPMDIADNTEYAGSLPSIEVPSVEGEDTSEA